MKEKKPNPLAGPCGGCGSALPVLYATITSALGGEAAEMLDLHRESFDKQLGEMLGRHDVNDEERRAFLLVAKDPFRSVTALVADIGISRSTFYRWGFKEVREVLQREARRNQAQALHLGEEVFHERRDA